MEKAIEKEIDNHLAPYEKQLGKKFKGVKKVYKEHLKNNSTRIRLQEKLKKRREEKIIELSKSEW